MSEEANNELVQTMARCEDRMRTITHTLNNSGNFLLDEERIQELEAEYAELEAEIQGIQMLMSLNGDDGLDTDGDVCVVCQG